MPSSVPAAREGSAPPVNPDTAAADRISGLDRLELGGQAKEDRQLGLKIWRSAWPKLLAVAIAIGVWQAVFLARIWDPWVLPDPLTVLEEMTRLIPTASFWESVQLTMTRAVIGFLVAVVIGTVIGIAVARFAPLRAAIGSLITGLQTMPSILWFPLAILLFQLSESAILFVVIIGAAPSVANGLISGIDYVPRTWLRVGQVLGMKGIAKYRHLILPASLPSFVSGLKQGWAFAWRSLMAGELLVIVPGALSIGVRVQGAREFNEAALLIGWIIVVLIIGILIDILFNSADNALRRRWGLTGA